MPPTKIKSTVSYNARDVMGMKISTPAIISLIAYIVLALVIILPFEFPVTDERTGEVVVVKYDIVERLIVLLLLLIPVALSVYTINCMMSGNCVLWSYIISLISVFWVILFVISAFVYTMRKSKKE
jgi:hypothetical protein